MLYYTYHNRIVSAKYKLEMDIIIKTIFGYHLQSLLMIYTCILLGLLLKLVYKPKHVGRFLTGILFINEPFLVLTEHMRCTNSGAISSSSSSGASESVSCSRNERMVSVSESIV